MASHPFNTSMALCALLPGACWVSFSLKSAVPHAHWEAYGCGGFALHNLVSNSAHRHDASDPLPHSFVVSVWK